MDYQKDDGTLEAEPKETLERRVYHDTESGIESRLEKGQLKYM